MSDFLFDLNIKNYSIDELRGMLDLNIPYSEQEILEQTNGLKNKLFNVADLSDVKKENIMSFLVQAKDLLAKDLNDEFEFLKKTNIQYNNPNNDSNTVTVVQKSIQPGLINPIERNIIQSVINFDTRFDTSVSENITCVNNEYILEFPTTFQNVVSIKVHSLELPNFLYNISDNFKNNTFDIVKTVVDPGRTTITIPNGKYTKSELATTMTSQLGTNFTCTIDSITGLTTIKNTNNNAFDLSFNANVDGKINLGRMLGYKKNSFVSETSGSHEVVISSCCADIDFSKYHYLSVNDFQQSMDNNVLAFISNDFVSKNILAKAQSKDNENNNLFLKRNYFGPISLEKIRFSLLDHYGEVLDLNGIDYSFSLVIERLYKF